MEDTLDDQNHHLNCVGLLCRVCCQRVQTQKEKRSGRAPRTCEKYHSLINEFYNIDTSSDSPLHSPYTCSRCYLKGIHSKQSESATSYYKYREECKIKSANFWNDCNVCQTFEDSCKHGGSRNKPVKRGSCVDKLPFEIRDSDVFAHLWSSYIEFIHVPEGKVSDHCDLYTCSLCKSIFSTHTVATPCYHYFCSVCLSKIFTFEEKSSILCPTCDNSISYQQIRNPSRYSLPCCYELKLNVHAPIKGDTCHTGIMFANKQWKWIYPLKKT